MYDSIETINYKGYDIEVYPDESDFSPRDWDNLGTMLCFHKRYDLGDKTYLSSNDFSSWDEIYNYLVKEEKACIILPLYMYDHSGIRIKVGDFYNCGLAQGHAHFDSGQIGFIYITKDKIRSEYSVKRISKKLMDRVSKYLQGEVETYDQYVSGEVYGYNTEEINDSCWGFYDYDHMIEEAKGNIDYHIVNERHKHFDILKSWIRSKVNLQYRTACKF